MNEICTPSLGARCRVFIFLIIVFGQASTSGSIYKTGFFFSLSCKRVEGVGLYIPCVGRMAVERCLHFLLL